MCMLIYKRAKIHDETAFFHNECKSHQRDDMLRNDDLSRQQNYKTEKSLLRNDQIILF